MHPRENDQISSETQNHPSMPLLYRDLLTPSQREMLQRAIDLPTFHEVNTAYSTSNELSLKYRKMIPNLKMKKSKQTCSICLQTFVENEIIKKLPCSHILHKECAKQWLKGNKKCPICRMDIEAHFKRKQEMEKKKEEGKGENEAEKGK